MQQQLISLNPDLKQLQDKGYEIMISGGYVVIHHIPYVNGDREVKYGTLISQLTMQSATLTGPPNTHAIYFMGEVPCHKDGTPMNEILNSSPNQPLHNELMGNHYFSSRPTSGTYKDHYDKFKRYIDLLGAPAKSLDRDATARTYKPVISDEETVFQYLDTNASRANITHLNDKFKGHKVGIIGLGGTGSYILDLVSKAAVSEIHIFDGDRFSTHNAFRSPGAASVDDLSKLSSKTEYFYNIYSRIHKGVIPHEVFVNEKTRHLLQELNFVFLCVDNNVVRWQIIKILLELKISFIDVGLGVTETDGQLTGILRTTTGTKDKNDHLEKRISSEDSIDNDYVTNIQIAELNALNAVQAVIKWKKIVGFYQDRKLEHHSTYSINISQLLNGDTTA